MEIDSKPEAMDKLDRRIIQLKIEREAVKKEKDEASIKRFGLIEDEIAKLQKEYSDLEEIWKAERLPCMARRTSRKRSRSSSCRWPSCSARAIRQARRTASTASCRSSRRS